MSSLYFFLNARWSGACRSLRSLKCVRCVAVPSGASVPSEPGTCGTRFLGVAFFSSIGGCQSPLRWYSYIGLVTLPSPLGLFPTCARTGVECLPPMAIGAGHDHGRRPWPGPQPWPPASCRPCQFWGSRACTTGSTRDYNNCKQKLVRCGHTAVGAGHGHGCRSKWLTAPPR